MCLAQGPQRNDAGEARTRGPSVIVGVNSNMHDPCWAQVNYCKFGNFARILFCDFKYLRRGHDKLISVIDRVIFCHFEDFFTKIKPSRKFPNLQFYLVPLGRNCVDPKSPSPLQNECMVRNYDDHVLYSLAVITDRWYWYWLRINYQYFFLYRVHT